MEPDIFLAAYTYIQRYKPLELIRVHATQQTSRYCRERFPAVEQGKIQRAVVTAWRQYIEKSGEQNDRDRQRLGLALATLPQGNAARYLNQREQEVLALRFGLGDQPIHSLADIGRIFNITRERVRQIEENALRKLRLHNICGSQG